MVKHFYFYLYFWVLSDVKNYENIKFYFYFYFPSPKTEEQQSKSTKMWKSHNVIFFFLFLIFRLHIFSLLVYIELSKEVWAH